MFGLTLTKNAKCSGNFSIGFTDSAVEKANTKWKESESNSRVHNKFIQPLQNYVCILYVAI